MKIKPCPKCNGEVIQSVVQIDIMCLDKDDRWTRDYYCLDCKAKINGADVEPEPEENEQNKEKTIHEIKSI